MAQRDKLQITSSKLQIIKSKKQIIAPFGA
jgi:hypothetical protein